MSPIRLFAIDLAYTIASVCLCAVLAFLISYIVGFIFFNEAFIFQVRGGSIDNSKLREYDQMRLCLVWVGVGAGGLVAQSVFLVRYRACRDADA